MYMCFTTYGGVRAGDIVILEKNDQFGEVSAAIIGGGIVGFLTENQPEGCLSKRFVENTIGSKRLIGHAVVVNGNVALFESESSLIGNEGVDLTRRRAVFR